jgi:mercuric ion transport protein
VLATIAASICCLGPPLLVVLGVGGAWAASLRRLEPFRPAFIGVALALLALAFYRAYRKPVASCDAGGSCTVRGAPRFGRAILWMVTPLALAVLGLPYIARHLHCGSNTFSGTGQTGTDACCAIPPGASAVAASSPQTQPQEPIDPAREIIFKVENLQCPAVKGVGCGSMLAPVLSRMDRVPGVSHSFSNWTGTRLRISAAPGADRDAVAERVQSSLSGDGRQPIRLDENQLTQVLQTEDWHSAAALVDLSSYEFRTIAKWRLAAFADAEQFDFDRRDKLLKLVDQLWERSAQGLDQPGSEAGAYSQYWHARLDQFIGAYTERARDVLTPEQVQKLLRQYRQRVKPPADE